MGLAVDIVKRRGKRPTESFSRDKLHDSIRITCLSLRTPEGEADAAAHAVCDAVVVWLDSDRPEVTSDDIRRVAGRTLKTYHPEAAYYYEQHKNII